DDAPGHGAALLEELLRLALQERMRALHHERAQHPRVLRRESLQHAANALDVPGVRVRVGERAIELWANGLERRVLAVEQRERLRRLLGGAAPRPGFGAHGSQHGARPRLLMPREIDAVHEL